MNGLHATSNSNTPCQIVANHVARRVGANVQRRIDALKIGQKMQDLPEELWHESFKFYVKHDSTRKGGPNLRMIRVGPDRPSLTVTGYIFNKFVHPYENRFITVREAARLQGFPDEVKFAGTLTSTQLQVGNAVPVPLAKAVFEQVVKAARALGWRTLKAFSLFSGAGGMDIGAQYTGSIDIRIALDSWQDACATLSGFFQVPVCVLEQDIAAVEDPLSLWQEKSGTVAGPDLVFGGPPCQAFSQAGKQRGLQDCRGRMIFEFLRFVEQLNPPFFVMENVSNLKGMGGGSLYQQILHQMGDLGYNVSVGVLLAADFGAPQLRRRLFFLGCRQDLGMIHLPLPTHGSELELFQLKPYVTVGEAFAGLPEIVGIN